jgi:hypothetical protein
MSSLHEESIPGRHEYLICVLLGLMCMTEWQLVPYASALAVIPSSQHPNWVVAHPPSFLGLMCMTEWQLFPYWFAFAVIPSSQHPNWVVAHPPTGMELGLGLGGTEPGQLGSCSQSAIDVYMPFGSLWQDGRIPADIGVHE